MTGVAVHVLDNTAFGFPTGCFVCDPENGRGLHVAFVHDDEANKVSADFTLGVDYSGAPRFVHGGIVTTLMDEAMAWAAIAIAGRFAVARESHVRFRKPVKVGEPHQVEAEIVRQEGKDIEATAQVLDGRGKTCASSAGTFVILSERMARSAIGADIGDNADYLR